MIIDQKYTLYKSSLLWHDYWQQAYTSYVIFVMAWWLATSVHFICHLCQGMIIDIKCTLHMSSLPWHEYWQVYTSYVIFVKGLLLTTSVHLIFHLCKGMIIDNTCTLYMSSLSWRDYWQQWVYISRHLCHGMSIWNPTAQEGVGIMTATSNPLGKCQYPCINHLHNYSGWNGLFLLQSLCVCVCVRACVRACMRVSVCVCVRL